MGCEIIPIVHIPSNLITSASIHLAWAPVNASNEQFNWKKAKYCAGRKALSIAASSSGIDEKGYSFNHTKKIGGRFASGDGNYNVSASITHSGGIALGVICEESRSIGIDTEHTNRIVSKEIIAYICNEKLLGWLDSIENEKEVVALWTNIEAVCKATGYGLPIAKELELMEKGIWRWGSRIFKVLEWLIFLNDESYWISIAIEESGT
jgi:phosphopantetheinyl transferase